jgi:hypothetical protein
VYSPGLKVVWLRLDRNGDHAQATLFFSRYGDTPSAELPESLAATTVTMRTVDSQAKELLLSPIKSGDEGEMVLATSLQLLDDKSRCVETSFRYGLYHESLCHYYAKAVSFSDDRNEDDLDVCYAKNHRLDIIPSLGKREMTIAVDWDGIAHARAKVLVVYPYPSLREVEYETGRDGSFVMRVTKPGLYSFRTYRFDRFADGKLDGVAYTATRYYATLTVNVSDAMVANTSNMTNFAGSQHLRWRRIAVVPNSQRPSFSGR